MRNRRIALTAFVIFVLTTIAAFVAIPQEQTAAWTPSSHTASLSTSDHAGHSPIWLMTSESLRPSSLLNTGMQSSDAMYVPTPVSPPPPPPPAPVPTPPPTPTTTPPSPVSVSTSATGPTDVATSPTIPPAPAPTPTPSVGQGGSDATSTNTADWACIRNGESSGNYTLPSGAYGILQSTAASYGWPWPIGSVDSATQDGYALFLYNSFGWQPWSTAAQCGL